MKRLLQQQDFRALFDSTLDAILVADDDGVHIAVNPAACRLLKASESEIVGHTIAPFISPERREQSKRNWQNFLKQEERSGEVELICADGTLCIAEFKAKANFLPGQHLSVLRDVTERKRAEAALVESNRRTISIMESVSDALLAFDHEWRFLYANPQSEVILGRPPHEVLGKNLWEEYPQALGTVFEESYQRAARENVPVHFQGYNKQLETWLEVHIYPSDVGITVYLRDINDRRQAEDNLRFLSEAGAVLSSSLEHADIIENLAELTISFLADWCAIDVVEEGQIQRLAVLHKDPAKIEFAREFQNRYPPDKNAPTGVPQVLRTGESQLWDDIPDELLESSAPDPVWLEMVRSLGMRSIIMVPLVSSGQTIGAMTLVREKSGRRYSASDLVVAQELGRRAGGAVENGKLFRDKTEALRIAETANRTKDEFLATLSHELRTPLNAILGWSRLVNDSRLGEEEKAEGLEIIQRNALLQAHLVEDILDVSRIITGKLKLEMQTVDLSTLIESAIESVLPAAQAKEIRLQRVIDSSNGSSTHLISGDSNRLQQVFWNLLSNAIKFTPARGRVQIGLEPLDSHVEIVVADTGVGINAEVLPHVFERFRQADQSITRNYGGLGLGLAIVRHIVEAHGGTVEAQSAGEGQGATFTVKLPLVTSLFTSKVDSGNIALGQSTTVQGTAFQEHSPSPAHRGDKNQAVPLEFQPELQNLQVLVVDDEEDARHLVSAILGKCGANVTTASNAAEAFQLLKTARPDVLISDLGMPGDDGYSLIRWVRALPTEQGGQTPAVALTAYARMEDRLQVLRSGFQIHLPKPIEPVELIAVVANLAGTSKP